MEGDEKINGMILIESELVKLRKEGIKQGGFWNVLESKYTCYVHIRFCWIFLGMKLYLGGCFVLT